MGYTHYWTQTRDFRPEEMGDIAAAVRRIIKTAATMTVTHTDYSKYPAPPVTRSIPVVIRGHDGTGAPTLNKQEISFNGDASRNLDHETFYFAAKRTLESWQSPDWLGSSFCKTARKPYDVVVTAVLTLLQSDYGFEVSSDGDMEDWEAGVALAEEALGRRFANPIVVEELVR